MHHQQKYFIHKCLPMVHDVNKEMWFVEVEMLQIVHFLQQHPLAQYNVDYINSVVYHMATEKDQYS